MAREARVFAEGTLKWVQASGTGPAWATASAPASATVGFVQAGVSTNSAATIVTVKERGFPHHHKQVGSRADRVAVHLLASGDGEHG